MVHAHTRKRELVDKLFHFGISNSYDRLLRISAQMGDVCQQFHREQVVCPTKMRGTVFTTAAVDNIDHNPSSTTAKESFHGTAISLFQHSSFTGEGVNRSLVIAEGSEKTSNRKIVINLPYDFTNIPIVTSTITNLTIPPADVVSLCREGFTEHRKDEYLWLDHVRQVLEKSDVEENTSWAAFHARRQPSRAQVICPTSLLPLFLERAHTIAMKRHSMNVFRKCIEYLNPGQIPVITFDQPLFALAKKIQWKWSESYGEDELVVMFGGLHIELAALKMVGDWQQGSGWVHALVQAEITTPGTADSFLHASHITRTRRAHQVTASALYILQKRAYDRSCQIHPTEAGEIKNFQDWCHNRTHAYPQFKYRATVLEIEVLILIHVRSLRQALFTMYLDALTELAAWIASTTLGGYQFT